MQYSLYDYTIKIFPDTEDGDFIATLEEIPSISAFADSPEGALKELEIAFHGCQEVAVKENIDLPKPSKWQEKKHFSGKFSLRLPRTLHGKLAERANAENISLNQEILYLLALSLGVRRESR
jgi:antitoxin HicB